MSLADEAELDRPEDRALLRRAAAAGTVLLRNDGVLPLELSGVRSLAVIGPNADRACVMGGGSAQVNPYPSATLLEALRARLAGRVALRYEPGCDISRITPPLGRPDLAGEAVVTYFKRPWLPGRARGGNRGELVRGGSGGSAPSRC